MYSQKFRYTLGTAFRFTLGTAKSAPEFYDLKELNTAEQLRALDQ